jgi:HD-GYP domain-containing protein (c-di-GMP phosphodiesterase class II)
VTGVAIDFGLSLGVGRTDLERLYSAAMFHDIGKAQIPLAILDKPGRLDAHERAMIETHPAAGYDFLKDQEKISPEILDAVRHHHEYLDGSGYRMHWPARASTTSCAFSRSRTSSPR